MENVYDMPLEVVAGAVNGDVNHNESDPADAYVNASEAAQPRFMVAEDDEDHEYSEIIKTVTVTKDLDGDGVADIVITKTTTTTTTITTNEQQENEATAATIYVNSNNDDAVSEKNHVRHAGDDSTSDNHDVVSEKNDSGSNSEVILGVARSDDAEEKSSVHGESSLLVEKLVEKELEGERIVEMIAEKDLNEGIGSLDRESEVGADDRSSERGNIYENITEVEGEIQQQQQPQQQQQNEEEELYDETYATLEETTSSSRNDVSTDHSGAAAATVATFAAVEPINSIEHQEVKSTQKTPPATSGKFVLRSVSRADPRHVVQCITQNSVETSQHNPEQDELVTYLKGETEGSELKQKIKSWITSPLIQQFNKEAESGSEVVHTFLPKQQHVGASAVRSTASGPAVTREVRSPTSPPAVAKPAATAAVTTDLVTSSSENPKERNAEIAKAVEAAEFKPVPHVTQQNGGVHTEVKKKETVEDTSNIAQGLSVYSKQSRAEPVNGLGATAKQNNADWKVEVEKRKQTKDFIPIQKPSQPLKLAEVPEWKKALAEKNKQRKSTSGENASEPTSAGVRDEKVEEVQWRKEIQQILKQKSVTGGDAQQQHDEIPEWQKIADSRK